MNLILSPINENNTTLVIIPIAVHMLVNIQLALLATPIDGPKMNLIVLEA